jgi:L,D-transpeptidase catalytic domain/Putative peptidoglycan binding domain
MSLPPWVPAENRRIEALAHAARAALAEAHRSVGPAGATVTALQRRLAALGYLPRGYVTASYDYRTLQAVTAFQGWEGLGRDGVAGPITLGRLGTARRPQPWSTVGRHMELHKAQQVLLLVEGGAVVRAIHVSTAAPGHVTPDGTFAIYRKERMSWSVPFQVWMPYASYFTGGYALHEYPDVPPYPASHGCVRVPAGESIVVWDFATIGTRILIG